MFQNSISSGDDQSFSLIQNMWYDVLMQIHVTLTAMYLIRELSIFRVFSIVTNDLASLAIITIIIIIRIRIIIIIITIIIIIIIIIISFILVR